MDIYEFNVQPCIPNVRLSMSARVDGQYCSVGRSVGRAVEQYQVAPSFLP